MNRPECHCFLYLRTITKLIPMKKLVALLLLPLGSLASGRAHRRSRHGVQAHRARPQDRRRRARRSEGRAASPATSSRAKTGGIKGALGVAEDKSEASIDCRQVGPIAFAGPLPDKEEMFTERISLVFKKIRVVRMVDRKRNALVYLTYSDRVIEGSPQNSVTAVAVDRATPIPTK